MSEHAKTQFYYFAMILSLCVIGVFAIQPKLIDRGLAFLGLGASETEEPPDLSPYPVLSESDLAPKMADSFLFAPTQTSSPLGTPLAEPASVQGLYATLVSNVSPTNEMSELTRNEERFESHPSVSPSGFADMAGDMANTPVSSAVLEDATHNAAAPSLLVIPALTVPLNTESAAPFAPAPSVVPSVPPTNDFTVPDETGFEPHSDIHGIGFASDFSIPNVSDSSAISSDWSHPTLSPPPAPAAASVFIDPRTGRPQEESIPAPATDPRSTAGMNGVQPPTYRVENGVIVEWLPLPGTEMVARVGTEVILGCDVITQARRDAILQLKEILKKASPEELAKFPQSEREALVEKFTAMGYPAHLDKQIQIALLYSDFVNSQPNEMVAGYEKQFSESYDREIIPKIMEEYGVKTYAELKQLVQNEYGSSLEREKTLIVRQLIAGNWLQRQVEEASGECTHPQMKEYYEAHINDFEFPATVVWEQLSVRIPDISQEQAAYDKIKWMGNSVIQGQPFAVIAQKNSEGPTARAGGLWERTTIGTLRSKVLEKELFTMPQGRLSPILRDDFGFHIVRVLEREETRYTPFTEAQIEIRKRIKNERTKQRQAEYFASLAEKFPVEKTRPTMPEQRNAARPEPIQSPRR